MEMARTGRDLEMDFMYNYKCSGELNSDFSFKTEQFSFIKTVCACMHRP